MRIKVLTIAIAAVFTVLIYFMVMMKPYRGMEKPEDEGYSGEIFRLAEKRISSKASRITVRFVPARTLKFVAEAPTRVTAAGADNSILSVGATDNVDPDKPFGFPVSCRPGNTELTIDYRVFCCNSGPGAVCFFKEGRVSMPVTVVADGAESLDITHMIDE